MANDSQKNVMKNITLENFGYMSGDWIPVDDKKKYHQTVKNAIPPLYYFVPGSSSASESTNPFTLSKTVTSIGIATTGSPAVFLPSYGWGQVLMLTNRWQISADLGGGSSSQLASPQVLTADDVLVDMVLYNGSVVISRQGGSVGGGSAVLYYSDAVPATTWNLVGSQPGNSTPHFLEVFSGNCYFTDWSVSATADRRLVKYLDTGWSNNTGLDLGINWFVQGLKNYNDKYLAVFASFNDYAYGNDKTTLFLWNGTANNNADYAIGFNARYQGSIIKDSTMYILTTQATDVVIWELNNLSVLEKKRFKNFTITKNCNPKSTIGVWGNFIVFKTDRGVMCWNPDTDESFIIYHDATNPVTCLAPMDFSSSSAGFFMYFGKNALNYFYKFDPTNNNTIGTASYQSNRIPIPEGRGKIEFFELLYNNSPPTTNDTIAIILNYKDEYDTQSAVLNQTYSQTINSANADLGRTAARAVGANCTKFDVAFTITAATTNWNFSLYKLIIYYTPLDTR